MSLPAKCKIQYGGSIFWLVFWAILFFPVALVLLGTRGKFEWEGKTYWISYTGSVFWLAFWVIVFIPVGIILALVNGFEVRGDGTLAAVQI
jgi:hypothetical protein